MNIGVASSIAAEQQFDWQVTADLATQHACDTLQLFAPERLPATWPHIKNFQNILIHLPGMVSEYPSLSQLQKLSDHFTPQAWIVHQQAGLSISDFLERNKLPDGFAGHLAIENDDHLGSPDSFLNCLKLANKKTTQFSAVLDIHRFYVNFSSAHTSAAIEASIYETLVFCAEKAIPIILHVVDSKSFSASRDEWCALFDGHIPYKKIFLFLSEQRPVNSTTIFEYEDAQLAALSIERLKKFLKIENAKL